MPAGPTPSACEWHDQLLLAQPINVQVLVTFKSEAPLEGLLLKAKDKTDLQAAQEMQQAKAELFELFNKPRRKSQA